jgi:hypothetical protein
VSSICPVCGWHEAHNWRREAFHHPAGHTAPARGVDR